MTTRANLPGFLVEEIRYAGHIVRWHSKTHPKERQDWQCEVRLVIQSKQELLKTSHDYPMEEYRYFLWQQAASKREDVFSPGSHLEIKNTSSRQRIGLGWTPAR